MLKSFVLEMKHLQFNSYPWTCVWDTNSRVRADLDKAKESQRMKAGNWSINNSLSLQLFALNSLHCILWEFLAALVDWWLCINGEKEQIKKGQILPQP